MPDSILHINNNIVRLNGVIETNDSIKTLINQTTANINEQENKFNAKNVIGELLPVALMLIIFIYFISKIIKLFEDKINLLIRKNEVVASENYSEKVRQTNKYLQYNGNNLGLNDNDIIDILERYFVYYKNLEKHLQNKFYERLRLFMSKKQFIIHSNEPFKEMPVLISAAAVQISFGLDDFELPHYQYIQIHKEEYFAQNSLHILAGNVQGNCITLAWNHLLKGYNDYEDGSNVGLHEMAHALYFQEMNIDKDNDAAFATYFNELMYRGETVLQQNQCPHNLYSNYAFTNLQEFWAVSVELFFEKATHLNNHYPKVFETLQNVLNQNPMNITQPI